MPKFNYGFIRLSLPDTTICSGLSFSSLMIVDRFLQTKRTIKLCNSYEATKKTAKLDMKLHTNIISVSKPW